jgi:GDP-mannose 6-dehydrogenase
MSPAKSVFPRVAVFGLGHVGCVTAACLAAWGHMVTGVDVVPEKVARFNGGRSTVREPGLERLVRRGRRAGRLAATGDVREAVAASDVGFVCVGTPAASSGDADLSQVMRVCKEIAAAAAERRGQYTVVVRSTVPPGTTRAAILPLFHPRHPRTSRVSSRVDVLYHPEFLREGSAIDDFNRPALVVIGEARGGSARRLLRMYRALRAPTRVVGLDAAEMVKYATNAFHALKATFANEIGQLCTTNGIDPAAVMDALCADTTLNISPAYLRPGFAWGGPCLGKDLRALLHRAAQAGVALPLLQGALDSNGLLVERTAEAIHRLRPARIGLVGLAFKRSTDELRDSPYVALASSLIRRGYAMTIYDPGVRLPSLMGANKGHADRMLPNLSSALADRLEELDRCDVIIVGHAAAARARLAHWTRRGVRLVHLGP